MTVIEYLKIGLVLILVLGGVRPAAGQEPGRAAGARPPNVVLILTDDQGTLDVNAYGAADLATPHLDALVARGVRFSQFYAAAPVCSPSRAALMTGRYPLRAGLATNAPSAHGHAGMPTEAVTMAEMLRAAGYATAHVGKWHLGYTPETMPNAQGFDYSFGHMGGCIDNYSHFFYWDGPNRHDLWRDGEEVYEDGRYFPDLMVEEAGAFMEEHQGRPFFIYFALNTPHYPYQGEARWLTHYSDLPYPRSLYAAFLSSTDERIGRLLARIDALGLREDTIVIFQSDHGHSTEERAHGGGGFAGPYRGAKFSLFEGGIRVPAVIAWPGTLPEGALRAQLAHGTDWLPTVAALTGAPLLDADVDGKSLVDVLHAPSAPSPHDAVYWHVGRGETAQWAVRQGDWKLIGNVRDTSGKGEIGPDDRLFLSNLKLDASERTNLASAHPDVVRRLHGLYETWLAGAEGGYAGGQ